jgi:hypothetical protein
MVKLYARMTGLILLVIGVMGFLTDDLLGLIQFDAVHNMIHFLIAAIAMYVGFGTDDTGLPHLFAEVVGCVFVLLGLAGFINPVLFGLLGPFHLEPFENLLHLMLGLWGIGVTIGIGKTRMAHS